MAEKYFQQVAKCVKCHRLSNVWVTTYNNIDLCPECYDPGMYERYVKRSAKALRTEVAKERQAI